MSKICYYATRIINKKQKCLICNRVRTINIEKSELHNKATKVRETAMLLLLRRPLKDGVTLCAFQKYWRTKTS
jgi:hypothetical protein